MLFFSRKIKNLPKNLHLCALEETWIIEYSANKKDKKLRKALQELDKNRIQITAASFHGETIKKLLKKWLKQKAAFYFTKTLNELQKTTHFSYRKLTIRGSRARWGSCTEDCSLSLNYKLLFIPAPLVRYILLHELCHTQEFNHSRKFWDLLAKFEPKAKALQQETIKAHKYLPTWVE